VHESEHVTAVEIDRDLVHGLRARFPTIEVISGDVLKIDLIALLGERGDARLVGNLPYNISTPLLGRLLDVTSRFRDMHFLLQKEVVDRLAARAGSKDWSRLSVMMQAAFDVEPLFDVEPESFRPRPKVRSTFVQLVPHARSAIIDRGVFIGVVRAAFQGRRKRLSNALQSLSIDWSRVRVDPALRPDAVDVEGYIALANQLAERAR
jgi:16S rRNA (adenine1518-N6/adenine1519-N6)-dimethyltransferase